MRLQIGLPDVNNLTSDDDFGFGIKNHNQIYFIEH